MEGFSLTREMLAIITGVGVIPSIIIMGVCVFFIIRELKKSVSSFKDSLEVQKKMTTEEIKQLRALIDEQQKKLRCIEKDYLQKEQH